MLINCLQVKIIHHNVKVLYKIHFDYRSLAKKTLQAVTLCKVTNRIFGIFTTLYGMITGLLPVNYLRARYSRNYLIIFLIINILKILWHHFAWYIYRKSIRFN